MSANVAQTETPARLNRRLTGDLDNIVLKALRKEPERRYASAEQLAEDIRLSPQIRSYIALRNSSRDIRWV